MKVNTNSICLASLLLFSIFVSGCATYGGGNKTALLAVEKGNYPLAMKEMQKVIKKDGDDRLLYHLEFGLLKHLNQQYQDSNRDLSIASQIAEDLETQRVSNLLSVAMSNPRNGVYRGTKYERAFIHYYKALNYIALAFQHPENWEAHLEGSRIESRKVSIILTAIQKERGDYQELKDKKSGLFTKLVDTFNKLSGKLDKDSLVFRDDAYIRYLTGIVYEANREYDDARISYQQSAKLYEQGYSKQYHLGDEITEQAWFDTVRMMQWAGGYDGDWEKLAEKKLSTQSRNALQDYPKGQAQLIIVEHMGMIPARDEMNIRLGANPYTKQLVLTPVYTGSKQERHDQYAWFAAMYSDRSLIDVVRNFGSGGAIGTIGGLGTKKISLGPVWSTVEDLGLIRAIGKLGIRITIPYYRPHPKPFNNTKVWLNGTAKGDMVIAESVSQLALQEQLLNVDKDLQEALGREAVKAVLASGVSSAAGQGDDQLKSLLSLAGKAINTLTSQAETRNWLTLPYEIRVKRLPVEAGQHNIKLVTKKSAASKSRGGLYNQSEYSANIDEGQLYILWNRTTGLTKVKKQKPIEQKTRTALKPQVPLVSSAGNISNGLL